MLNSCLKMKKMNRRNQNRTLSVKPLTLKAANAAVDKLHRHHKKVRGHKFSLGAFNKNGDLVGVVIVGRPVARLTCQKTIAEVTRLATDGTPNACSFLYARAARVAKEMGYESIQTFILECEPGTSLKASGWEDEGINRQDGKGWNNRQGRLPIDGLKSMAKRRWRKSL